jgi:Protein of unknown function (DUF559)
MRNRSTEDDLDALGCGYSDQGRPGGLGLAQLAGKQHGVVAVWQLRQLGFDKHRTGRAVAAGRLHSLRRGVYAVGHARLTPRGRWMAAVLGCGPEAVLSHRAAAALHQLRPARSGSIDVTVPGRGRHSRAGLRVHNVRALDSRDRDVVDGIPVTSVSRTLLDYAEVEGRQWLRLAMEGAERQGELDRRALRELVARSPGRRGLGPLSAVLGELRDAAPLTRSEPENQALVLVRRAGLPPPQVNIDVCGECVDLYWPEQRLVVEVDPFWTHRTRRSFEDNRRRDIKLMRHGIRVARITPERIRNEGDVVAAEILALLRMAA